MVEATYQWHILTFLKKIAGILEERNSMLHKTIYRISHLILLVLLTSCSGRVPSEVQSICKDSVLMNTFITLQAATSLEKIFSKNDSHETFFENIEKARNQTANYDFSRATRTDGKSFSDWKRNEGPIEIVVPHRERDNALTVKCQITKDDKGEYLFSYPAFLGSDKLFAEKTIEEVQKLLSSDEAWEPEKKKLEAIHASEKAELQKQELVERGNKYRDKVLNIDGRVSEFNVAFKSRLKDTAEALGLDYTSYSSDVAVIEDLVSACADVLTVPESQYKSSEATYLWKCNHDSSKFTRSGKQARALDYRAYLYNTRANEKPDKFHITVSFERLPEDKFEPQHNDIPESVQLEVKYTVINSWIRGR